MIAEGLVKKARGMVAGSYKRVDDKDIKLSPTELYEIQNILRPSNDDRDIVPEATIDNLDVDVINQIIATAHVRNSKAVRGDADRAEILRRLNITDSNGDVRMAGLLVAGDYPQMFFPSWWWMLRAIPIPPNPHLESPVFSTGKSARAH